MSRPSAPVWSAHRPQPLDPDRRTVVFFHGVGGDHTSWQPQARYLAQRGFNTVVPDLPGHGRSPGPVPSSVAGFADWAAAFITGLGPASVQLAGHSMGSLIALETAARRPELVERLALVGSADRLRVHPELLAAARRGEQSAIDLMVAWSFPPADLGGGAGPGLSVAGAVRRVLEATPYPVLAAGLEACDGYDAAARAPAVKAPALLITGSGDRMAPRRAAAALAAALVEAHLLLIPDVGHAPALQRPLEVASALRGWFAD